MNTKYIPLLRQYCDTLVRSQLRGTGEKALDGGILCRPCAMIHGRIADAVYPLVYLAKLTENVNYLHSAYLAFDWSENVLCDDGGMYNDTTKTWQGTTVFFAISLTEALHTGADIIAPVEKAKWEERLRKNGEWLYRVLDETHSANINYLAANALALFLIGKYFNLPEYTEKAARLADFSMAHFTENGFLWGETAHGGRGDHGREIVSAKGCRPIDMGYNFEESLPALVKYAYFSENEEMLVRLEEILMSQLEFFLPDGAIDNSFGSRNNKWTYWGSRTSDGCISMFALLADRNPIFAEAADRAYELLKSCTHDGYLYGGPHYHRHGILPCIHHTFPHAASLAFAVEHGKNAEKAGFLPVDRAVPVRYFPEIDTLKIAVGDYRATLTGYDCNTGEGNHVSGGSLTLLYHYGQGPMIAGSTLDFRNSEANNFQLPLKLSEHRSLVPRLEAITDERRYASAYDDTVKMQVCEKSSSVEVTAICGLYTGAGARLRGDLDRKVKYTFTADGVTVRIENCDGTKYVLPLICGIPDVICGSLEKSEPIFYLTGGFEATEYVIEPQDGIIEFTIK